MKSYIVRNTGFLLPTSKKNGLLLSFVTGFSSLTLKIYEIIMHSLFDYKLQLAQSVLQLSGQPDSSTVARETHILKTNIRLGQRINQPTSRLMKCVYVHRLMPSFAASDSYAVFSFQITS